MLDGNARDRADSYGPAAAGGCARIRRATRCDERAARGRRPMRRSSAGDSGCSALDAQDVGLPDGAEGRAELEELCRAATRNAGEDRFPIPVWLFVVVA